MKKTITAMMTVTMVMGILSPMAMAAETKVNSKVMANVVIPDYKYSMKVKDIDFGTITLGEKMPNQEIENLVELNGQNAVGVSYDLTVKETKANDGFAIAIKSESMAGPKVINENGLTVEKGITGKDWKMGKTLVAPAIKQNATSGNKQSDLEWTLSPKV